MTESIYPLIMLALYVTVIFFLSRITVRELFMTAKKILKKDRLVYMFMAILLFPGTLLHEMAHYISAKILFLKVTEIKLIPEWHTNDLKLGHVTYMKADVFRGILVGIAPIFAGLAVLIWLSGITVPEGSKIGTALLIYAVLIISTTMFSSKQDLVDMIYVLPVIAGFFLIINLLHINTKDAAMQILNSSFYIWVSTYIYRVNTMLFFSSIFHVGAITVLKLLRRIMK